jgi:hypothetical protein
VTQIKLLVIMPVTDGEQDDGDSRDVPFTEHINAVLTFSDGWTLHANRADYTGAAAEGYQLGGGAEDPPVKEAIECLTRAAAPEAGADADNGAESGTEAVNAHTHREVLEFEVPEGRTSVRARVVPEVTMEDGEIHARVKVDDPNWARDSGSPE